MNIMNLNKEAEAEIMFQQDECSENPQFIY